MDNTQLAKPPIKHISIHSQEEVVCNVKEAAAYLKLSKASIYLLAAKKEIPSYKRGRKIFFFKNELTAWIKAGSSGPM